MNNLSKAYDAVRGGYVTSLSDMANAPEGSALKRQYESKLRMMRAAKAAREGSTEGAWIRRKDGKARSQSHLGVSTSWGALSPGQDAAADERQQAINEILQSHINEYKQLANPVAHELDSEGNRTGNTKPLNLTRGTAHHKDGRDFPVVLDPYKTGVASAYPHPTRRGEGMVTVRADQGTDNITAFVPHEIGQHIPKNRRDLTHKNRMYLQQLATPRLKYGTNFDGTPVNDPNDHYLSQSNAVEEGYGSGIFGSSEIAPTRDPNMRSHQDTMMGQLAWGTTPETRSIAAKGRAAYQKGLKMSGRTDKGRASHAGFGYTPGQTQVSEYNPSPDVNIPKGWGELKPVTSEFSVGDDDMRPNLIEQAPYNPRLDHNPGAIRKDYSPEENRKERLKRRKVAAGVGSVTAGGLIYAATRHRPKTPKERTLSAKTRDGDSVSVSESKAPPEREPKGTVAEANKASLDSVTGTDTCTVGSTKAEKTAPTAENIRARLEATKTRLAAEKGPVSKVLVEKGLRRKAALTLGGAAALAGGTYAATGGLRTMNNAYSQGQSLGTSARAGLGTTTDYLKNSKVGSTLTQTGSTLKNAWQTPGKDRVQGIMKPRQPQQPKVDTNA